MMVKIMMQKAPLSASLSFVNIRLILLAVVELVGRKRFFIHLTPEVGDIGDDKWDNKRYDSHCAQGKLA